jgi:nanoRNase/pAp phosphatase (c-di-AMP/oligoRNAs hydrolase)
MPEVLNGFARNDSRHPEDTQGEKPAPCLDKKKNGCLNGYQDFNEAIKRVGTKKVGLYSHRCPDPDAISAMMGVQWLLHKSFGIESELLYDGEVSHPQNGVMVNLLDPGLKRVSEANTEAYGLHILVDTIPENAGVAKKSIPFDVVIDHHRELPHNYSGVLIHRKCGSCAAIVFDMMRHFVGSEDWLNDDVDGDTKVATALIAGIVTDTEYMMSDDSTELEFKAFSELFPYRNSNFLKQIVFFKRPKFWIDKKAEGCTEAKINDEGFAVVGLGMIPEKQRDLIADMAEEMVSWASVETAIAFGVVGGDRIEGSVRSLNPSLTVSDFCRKLGGTHGTGGGKHGKGAYRLPLAGFSIDVDEEDEDVQEAWDSIKTRETKRIMRMAKK